MNVVRNDNRIKELEDELFLCKNVIQNKELEIKQILDESQNEKSFILVEFDGVKSERDYILE